MLESSYCEYVEDGIWIHFLYSSSFTIGITTIAGPYDVMLRMSALHSNVGGVKQKQDLLFLPRIGP